MYLFMNMRVCVCVFVRECVGSECMHKCDIKCMAYFFFFCITSIENLPRHQQNEERHNSLLFSFSLFIIIFSLLIFRFILPLTSSKVFNPLCTAAAYYIYASNTVIKTQQNGIITFHYRNKQNFSFFFFVII